jgi:hypothetical protein
VKLGREFQFQIFHIVGGVMLTRIAMMAVMLLATSSSLSAAIVSFKGVMSNAVLNTGGLVVPSGDFFLVMKVNPGGLGGNITSGKYVFGYGSASPVTLAVTSGSVITGNGSVSFSVNSPVPIGYSSNSAINSVFTFNIPGMTSGLLNPAKFALLTAPPSYTDGWLLNHSDSLGNQLAEYTGTISTVPEPSSVIALSGLVLGSVGYRWRKRKLAKVC